MKDASKILELRHLDKFVGLWHTRGKILATQTSGEILVTGTDSYEWLPGNFFLLHKADVLIGEERSQTHEIIGFNAQTSKYTMQYYNSLGDSGFMTASFKDGLWIFQSERLRFTGGFKHNGKEFSGIWEQLTDGKNWIHFMDIKLAQ